ncbi:hypothetical protein JCM10908_002739 [Rhodotorula pacifica]|uniref:class I SAM-dependent methyltransferase n=1 Tax=Rhodotorula pacifica TaxID=1495444 RepID=UPI0031721E19
MSTRVDEASSAFYPSGHDETVLRSHRSRTVQDSAAHLLPLLRKSDKLLDIGCGPGTITCGFAPFVASVTGIEHPAAGEEILQKARAEANIRGVQDSVHFQHADALALPFQDEEFDVVFCHQVLQHVSDSVGVLREMRRVSKRIVAAREADRGTFVQFPPDETLERFDHLWYAVARAGGGEPDAGRRLKSWAVEAGFKNDEVSVKAGNSTPEVREWSQMWAARTVDSDFARKAVELGMASEQELRKMAEAWRKWGEQDGAWYGYLHGELIAQKDH